MADVSGQHHRQDQLLDDVIARYLESVDAGTAIDCQQFIQRHPEHGPALRRYFENVALVEELARQESPCPPTSRNGNGDREALQETNSHPGSGVATFEPPVVTGGSGAELPRQFGRYEVLESLGRGGMGDVYLAYDTQLERRVALKVPRSDAADSAEILERFGREARSAARLRHRNICAVHDAGDIDGRRYISMEYIDGFTFKKLVDSSGPQPQAQVALMISRLADALAEAHRQGIIHRDLKSANVIVAPSGEPIITDFGLARRVTAADVEITQTGTLLGTPAYMSPEQVEGNPDRIGPASDIYSLGVVFYELLTGRLPFTGPLHAVLKQITCDSPPPPSKLRPDIDSRLEAICLKCLRRDPARRYPDADVLARELHRFLTEETPGRPRGNPFRFAGRWSPFLRGAALCLVGLVALVAYGTFAGWQFPGTGTSQPNAFAEPAHTRGSPVEAVGLGPPTTEASSTPVDQADPEREIALEVLRMGGTVDLNSGGASREFDRIDRLPAGQFTISWIMLPRCEHPVDSLLTRLGPLEELVGIDLYSTPLSDRGATALAAVDTLHAVYVHNTSLTDAGFAAIAELPKLRILVARDTQVTDDGVEQLAGRMSLQRLDVCGTRITDRGLTHLSSVPFLSDLNVADTEVSDAGVSSLRRLRHLEKLDVAGTRLTDDGLLLLAELPLTSLTCSTGLISEEGILRFTERKPDCHITLK